MTERKKSKVAQHFTDYRDAYIVGITMFTALSIAKKSGTVPNITVSPVLDNSAKIANELSGRVHPGKVIKVLEWDATFTSQNKLAEILGTTPGKIAKCLSGEINSINGLHLEHLGNVGDIV